MVDHRVLKVALACQGGGSHAAFAAGALKRALAEGVLGFLPKTAAAGELAAAVRTVAAGRRAIDPELAAETISSIIPWGWSSCRTPSSTGD